MGHLEPHFFWKNMENDVEARRLQCLQCIKVANGEKVPRPMATQMIPERPGEILMMDYITIWPSETGRKYVLMQMDKFAKQCELTPTFEATAVPACQGVMWWGSRYGLPEWLISDGGKHFANHALELLTERMGVEHHITLAYCPWANGSVEVLGRELLRTIRALLSEFKLALEKWEEVLSLIQFVVNGIL